MALATGSKTEIGQPQLMSVLSGVPSDASIKPGSLQIVSGSSVVLTGITTAYVDYGFSRVSFTLADGKHDDADVTVDIGIKHNYIKGSFRSEFAVGDKFYVEKPTTFTKAVYGSNPYHISSNMALAAQHAGLFADMSGHRLITITKKAWLSSFPGSTANGLTTFTASVPGTAFTIA